MFLITSFINCRGKVVQLRCDRGTSRPTHDVQPINPFHFIMHRKAICLPPASFKRTEQFHRRKRRKVKFLAHVLWKSWLREYLPLLQVREKGYRPLPNFKRNALILLVDENASRGRWNLGRVAQMLHLPETYYDVLHDAGPPTLGVPRGGGWGGACRKVWEVTLFRKDILGYHFSFHSVFRFPANFDMTFRWA